MDKNNYMFKEVLFGLRNEYLEIQKDLDELNTYIEVYNHKVDNAMFFIHQTGWPVTVLEKAELMCHITEKRNIIKKKIDELNVKLGRNVLENNNYKVLRDNNDRYYIIDTRCGIKTSRQACFSHKVSEIMDREFVRNIGAKTILFDKNGRKNYLTIAPAYIMLDVTDSERNLVMLHYSTAKGDVLRVKRSSFNITDEKIMEALNIEIPKDYFSEYHKSLIESSKMGNTSLEIEGSFGERNEESLYVIENPNKLVLKKRVENKKRK